jgi:deoxyribodipyrimidine photolyase-like uncharacterized protein
MNLKMISPQEVDKAIQNGIKDQMKLNTIKEGFVRQIMDWREYMRGFTG